MADWLPLSVAVLTAVLIGRCANGAGWLDRWQRHLLGIATLHVTARRFVAAYRRDGKVTGVLGWNMPKRTRLRRQELVAASLLDPNPPEELAGDVRHAAGVCPALAISLKEW
jgi:hypothetical protein